MTNDKLLLVKIILVLIILFSFSTMFGVIAYLNSIKNSPQIVVQPPNSDIDISDWKTYSSEKYGYEIKYPSDWEIDLVNSSSVQWFDSKYKDFYESPFINPLSIDIIEKNNKNIDDWILGEAENRIEFPYQKLEEITVAETKTFLLSDPITIGNDIETVFVLKNNNVYKISAPINKNNKQFKQILSTFKFTRE